jgi:hypothetical protein
MPAPKYTAEQRDEALAMVPEFGQAETARRLGIPKGTIHWWSYKAGVKAGCAEKTRAAVAVATADNAARRARIAAALLDDVERLRDQFWSACEVYNFGGKDNTFNTAEINQPGFRDKQAIATTMGIFLDKSLALERFDADGGQGLAAVDEWLRSVLGK